MIRRLLPPLLVPAVQLVAALMLLGRPDLGAAYHFITSTQPTAADVASASELVVWFLILLACVAGAGLGIELRTDAFSADRRKLWAATVIASGILVLSVGTVRHLTASHFTLAGGTVQQAEAQVGQ